MKKRNLFFKETCLALLMVFALMLSGCTSTPEAEPAPELETEQANQEVTTPENPDIILATTTSTQDSGLLDVLIPMFEEQTGHRVKPIAVGTGQALAMGEKGEADVLLTHAPASEKPLVESGAVTNYQLVMHNDFILVGPSSDPAKVKDLKSVADAFKSISETSSIFVSRGDDSGTDKKEKGIWKDINIPNEGSWYQETGQGMGQTLNIASQKEGYTLTDRATFLAQKDNLQLEIAVQGEKSLLNIYHVMQVNEEKFPKVNADGAKAFVEFMIDSKTQDIIGEFGMDEYGEPLFFKDAGKTEEEIGK